ncbi:M20 family metallopeptidase [Acuticoccus sediminis]|nr:M20 family metallopeptidase [Acuticoccus sediminis]
MTEQEQRLAKWFEEKGPEMLALTETLVNIDSGSYDKEGVDAVGRVLADWLEARGIECEWIPLAERGDAIRAVTHKDAPGREILLMGHRDTVFGKGEVAKRPYSTRDGRAYGPGVCDMKAGLVQNAFILAAFAELGGAPGPVAALFTGDEEIATFHSRPIIEAEAKRARAVFNAEPGRMSGNVVTGRRGGVFFVAEVFGKAAHSGNSFHLGRSAIAEIADKIGRWFAMNQRFADRNMQINVGLVSGGQSVNSVAPYARCEIDLRYRTPQDRDDLVAAVEEIATTQVIDGTRGEITIRGEYLPVAPTEAGDALFRHYRAAAGDLGIALDGEFTLSCADSGFTAAQGVPTICAIGPVGGHAHGPDEYLEIDTVVPRAQAVALAISRLGPETA